MQAYSPDKVRSQRPALLLLKPEQDYLCFNSPNNEDMKEDIRVIKCGEEQDHIDFYFSYNVFDPV